MHVLIIVFCFSTLIDVGGVVGSDIRAFVAGHKGGSDSKDKGRHNNFLVQHGVNFRI